MRLLIPVLVAMIFTVPGFAKSKKSHHKIRVPAGVTTELPAKKRKICKVDFSDDDLREAAENREVLSPEEFHTAYVHDRQISSIDDRISD